MRGEGRTPSMLKRYYMIALDDLRAAAEKGSEYQSTPGQVIALETGTRRERAE